MNIALKPLAEIKPYEKNPRFNDAAVDAVAVETDAAGNLKPSKKRSTERIDGIVAGIIALARAMLDHKPASNYETRGFLRL